MTQVSALVDHASWLVQVPENFLFVYKAPPSTVQRMQTGSIKADSQAAAVDQLLRADRDVEDDIDEEGMESDIAYRSGWPDLTGHLSFRRSQQTGQKQLPF